MNTARSWVAPFVLASACLGPVGATGEPYPQTDAEIAAERAVMQYYPPTAVKAGVQGMATLSCGHNIHWGLENCRLVSETPQGFGFGAAAMTLASHSDEDRQVPTNAVAGGEIRLFTFCLRPPTIVPNLLAPPVVITNPDWLVRPTARDATMFYPLEAQRKHLNGGRVLLECVVRLNTTLDQCRPIYELPSGVGFGDAALSISMIMRMTPQVRDGVPQDNAKVRVPVVFGPNPPPAPPIVPEPHSATTATPDQACAAIAASRAPAP